MHVGSVSFAAHGPSNDIPIVDAVTWTLVGRVPVGERPWGDVVIP